MRFIATFCLILAALLVTQNLHAVYLRDFQRKTRAEPSPLERDQAAIKAALDDEKSVRENAFDTFSQYPALKAAADLPDDFAYFLRNSHTDPQHAPNKCKRDESYFLGDSDQYLIARDLDLHAGLNTFKFFGLQGRTWRYVDTVIPILTHSKGLAFLFLGRGGKKYIDGNWHLTTPDAEDFTIKIPVLHKDPKR